MEESDPPRVSRRRRYRHRDAALSESDQHESARRARSRRRRRDAHAASAGLHSQVSSSSEEEPIVQFGWNEYFVQVSSVRTPTTATVINQPWSYTCI